MTLAGSVTVGAVDCDVSTELCKYYGAKHALCCIPPQQRPADLRKCTWMGAVGSQWVTRLWLEVGKPARGRERGVVRG
jgi:hypothetical protein